MLPPPLPVADRGPFLEEVAAALQDQPIGDGSVQRVVSEVQRKYFVAGERVRAQTGSLVQPRTKAALDMLGDDRL